MTVHKYAESPKEDVTELITQRKILSLVSSVFSSLGLYDPFNVEMRRLLKSIWFKCRQRWDDAVHAEAKAKYRLASHCS